MSIAFRKILVCLLAVFALGAIASASASAASKDEWQTCQEKAGKGEEPPVKYDNDVCNTQTKPLAERKWEWVTLAAGEKKNVVDTGGEFKLTSGTKIITCKKVKSEGTITGPGIDEATKITFEECTTTVAGCIPESAGGTAGTIVVTNIPTKLEQLTVGGKEVEVDLFEQKTVENAKKEKVKEFVTLEFVEKGGSCSEYPTTKVKGDVAAETATNSGELTFPSTPFEVTPKLEAFGLKATLTGKDTQTLTSGAAIRAI